MQVADFSTRFTRLQVADCFARFNLFIYLLFLKLLLLGRQCLLIMPRGKLQRGLQGGNICTISYKCYLEIISYQ